MAEHNPNTTCKHCQKPFYAKPYEIAKGERKYCSKPCEDGGARQREIDRFWSYVIKTDGCWGWKAALNKDGYGRFSSAQTATSPKRNLSAHRYAWELAHGPIPEGMEVLHHCDTPPCTRDEHLFLGTKLDNVADAVSKGRQARGERSNTAILTEEQVRAIHTEYVNRRGIFVEMARKYGVCPETISAIVRRVNWAHVL
jgi:hypothetical protein